MNLRVLSFHSVKGGVGKSTLATLAALQAARRHPARRVYLIDMDLTGTSLADVLPLLAPNWETSVLLPAQLEHAPTKTLDLKSSRELIALRTTEMNPRAGTAANLYVPFLNDFFLHQPSDDLQNRDVDVRSICWKFENGPPNLNVIPSSAIPGDLERIIPVIFDEQHAAFLEARLEVLLSRLIDVDVGTDVTVIVDVPPTIPGLSRSVMSLGLRLSQPRKQPLAANASIPQPLYGTSVAWTINLVTSPDPQDLRATQRWLTLILRDERSKFRLVVNRHKWSTAPDELRNSLSQALGLAPSADADPLDAMGGFGPFLDSVLSINDESDFEFFRRKQIPDRELDFGDLE